jgi:hypothetical protein
MKPRSLAWPGFSLSGLPLLLTPGMLPRRVRGDACRASPHPAPVRSAEGLRPPPGDRGPGRILGRGFHIGPSGASSRFGESDCRGPRPGTQNTPLR